MEERPGFLAGSPTPAVELFTLESDTAGVFLGEDRASEHEGETVPPSGPTGFYPFRCEEVEVPNVKVKADFLARLATRGVKRGLLLFDQAPREMPRLPPACGVHDE
ncbi:hypothetical protein QC385_23770 [Streptomyces sp. DH10]|nr:hypothetical protein [Streptomyces sp. DH10]MDG9711150.1 hypothetical protein [Streptomyces sp. DH10]